MSAMTTSVPGSLIRARLLAPPQLPPVARYGTALVLAGAAVAVTSWGGEVLQAGVYLVPLAAVALTAWLGGLVPALLAAASAAVLTWLFVFRAAFGSPVADAGGHVTPTILFLLVAALMGVLAESLRASTRTAAAATAEASRSAAEARARRLQTELILRSASDGITVQSAGGELIYANDAAARMIGFSTGSELLKVSIPDVLGKFEILDEAGEPIPPSALPGRVAIRDRTDSERLLRYRRKADGSERWTLVRASPALDESGAVLFAVNVFHDLTERIEHERELETSTLELRALTGELESTVRELRRQREQAEAARAEAEGASRAKSEFLAVMSHELRTPLNAIMGYQDLLEHEVAGPVNAKQREQLGRIGDSAHHLLDLIEKVLTLSRIEGGGEQVRREPVPLSDLVHQVVDLMEPLARKRGLDLDVHVERSAPAVALTDPARVRQILLNLLSNAIKFTDAGGVRVEVLGDDAITITVRDTGPGIPEEERSRIFEPFMQGSGTGVARAAGTGLGLAVARQLAELLGGTLTLDTAPGAGSAFTLRLPA